MKIKSFIIAVLMMIGIAANAQDAYIGEIRLFAGNYAPEGWALCQGQLLSINQNQALYAIIGNYFGGDIRNSTFALPDLRGRVVVQQGKAPSLNNVAYAEQGGVEKNVVTPGIATLTVNGVSLDTKVTGRDGAPSVVQTVTINNASNPNQELNNRPPYLALNYIICLQGIFPPRN